MLHMTDLAARITEIERLGLPLDEILRRADVHRTTWNRWKAGRGWPQMRKWSQVEEAVKALHPTDARAA
jgi:hypothetical protein